MNLTTLDDRVVPAIVDLTIQPTAHLDLFGYPFGGGNFVEQAAHSLVNPLAGVIHADVNFAANTLTLFHTGTNIHAIDNGSWQPGPGGSPGSAPANWGAESQMYIDNQPSGMFLLAARGFTFSVDDMVIPLTGQGATRTFPRQVFYSDIIGALDYGGNSQAGSGHEALEFDGYDYPYSQEIPTVTQTDFGYSIQIPYATYNYQFPNPNGYPIKFMLIGVIDAINKPVPVTVEYGRSQSHTQFTVDPPPTLDLGQYRQRFGEEI